jgi:hypothetical protein
MNIDHRCFISILLHIHHQNPLIYLSVGLSVNLSAGLCFRGILFLEKIEAKLFINFCFLCRRSHQGRDNLCIRYLRRVATRLVLRKFRRNDLYR